jgi:hypothetical protein
MVQAKFVCTEKGLAFPTAWEITDGHLAGRARDEYLETTAQVRVVLKPVSSGSEENMKPDGECRMLLLNKAAAAAFEIGKAYYLDFTPAN